MRHTRQWVKFTLQIGFFSESFNLEKSCFFQILDLIELPPPIASNKSSGNTNFGIVGTARNCNLDGSIDNENVPTSPVLIPSADADCEFGRATVCATRD